MENKKYPRGDLKISTWRFTPQHLKAEISPSVDEIAFRRWKHCPTSDILVIFARESCEPQRATIDASGGRHEEFDDLLIKLHIE